MVGSAPRRHLASTGQISFRYHRATKTGRHRSGFGWGFVWYAVLKLAIIIAAHSAVRWDRFLYRFAALRPLAWVVGRTTSTPATHFAHHALTQDDGIGLFMGNYGNMLFSVSRIRKNTPGPTPHQPASDPE